MLTQARTAHPEREHGHTAPEPRVRAARSTVAALAVMVVVAGCSRGLPGPAQLDTRADACTHCRMAVSDRHFAAQLVAPSEEPRFFDDVGCLRDWLRAHPGLPRGAVAFVADHRTGSWARADQALYAQVPGIETPMGSHLVAFADDASRTADAASRGGKPLGATDVFGPAGPPRGSP